MNGPNQELFAHLTAAIGRYSQELRRDGMQIPDDLAALLVFFNDCATVRQGATPLSDSPSPPHSDGMTHPLLTKRETAAALRLSVRQLERLLANPDVALSAVRIEGAPRIRRADLDAYVAGLGAGGFRDRTEEKTA